MTPKSHIEKLKKMNELWPCFPNTTALGSYNFMCHTVEMNSISRQDIFNLKNIKYEESEGVDIESFYDLNKVIPLLSHEYAHYFDNTSTLWGVKFLKSIYEGYSTDPALGICNESQYFKARSADLLVRSISLPKFYTIKEANVDPSLPWRYEVTTGVLFDNKGMLSSKPVFFLKFFNAVNEMIARSPISILSILESAAMAQEFYEKIHLLSLLDSDDRLVEEKGFERKTVGDIYDPALTEYSVCAHFVANKNNITNIIHAFTCASALARLCLNFPDQYFLKVRAQDDVLEQVSWRNSEIKSRIISGLNASDRPTLFYILAEVTDFSKSKPCSTSIKKNIKEGLKSLGIAYDQLYTDCQNAFDTHISQLRKMKFPPDPSLLNSSEANFYYCESLCEGVLPIKDLELPPFYLKDGSCCPSFFKKSKAFLNFSLDDHIHRIFEHSIWVDNFTEACQ